MTVETNWNAEARVGCGVAWMDAHDPDWVKSIDLPRLNQGDGCACVFGQRYGGYAAGHLRHALSIERARALGLYHTALGGTGRRDEYAALTAAWREAVARRRLADVPVAVPA